MFGATSDDYKSSSRSDGYWAAQAPPAGPKQNTGTVLGGEASAATPRGRGVLTKARRTPGSAFLTVVFLFFSFSFVFHLFLLVGG